MLVRMRSGHLFGSVYKSQGTGSLVGRLKYYTEYWHGDKTN